jgi:hypothetical protein
MTKGVVEMIKLMEMQQEIIDSNARVKLVMGGHRSGKTTLAIMAAWNMMGKNIFRPCVLFLVPTNNMQRSTSGDLGHLLKEHLINVKKVPDKHGGYVLFETQRGDIIVSDHFIPDPFGGYVFDNATSSKYVHPELLKKIENSFVYLTGHCPDDFNNAFFLMWLKAYFSDVPEQKAFRINSEDNPTMAKKMEEYELRLPDGSKYNRGYMCIPDFLDCIESNSSEFNKDDFFISRTGRNKAEFERRYLDKW